MFIVFGWRIGEQIGGVHDLLRIFNSEDAALAFTELLLNNDPLWQFQITNEELKVRHEREFPRFTVPLEVAYFAN